MIITFDNQAKQHKAHYIGTTQHTPNKKKKKTQWSKSVEEKLKEKENVGLWMIKEARKHYLVIVSTDDIARAALPYGWSMLPKSPSQFGREKKVALTIIVGDVLVDWTTTRPH